MTVQYVGIYLGSNCNYNCVYCDRQTINNSMMTEEDIPGIIEWLQQYTICPNETQIENLTFYGGEPFIWVDMMDKIMEQIDETICNKMSYHICTNGTFIERDKWFLKKWQDRLNISLSYDFAYQTDHRELPNNGPYLDINKALTFLSTLNLQQLEIYYTMTINKSSIFSMDRVTDIVKLFNQYNRIDKLSILPVRFDNHTTPNNYLTNTFPIKEFIQKMIKFSELLYVAGIPVVIDGIDNVHSGALPSIENQTLHILSPDGNIYNDYVFLEYNYTEASFGNWRTKELCEFKETIRLRCKTCSVSDICNDKYYYKVWFTENDLNNSCCEEFNKMIVVWLNKYLAKLKTKQNLVEHIYDEV